MMKKMKRKGIAGILSAVLIIAGAILIGTPGSKVLAEETIPNLDKFLHVKWQVSENAYQSEDGETVKDLRIVSTIDADEDETYGNVGFEIKFLKDTNDAEVKMEHRVKSVFHRIVAKEDGIKYEYGPKAFHATSEWLATCTITEIPKKYWDNGILVKPYVTLKGSSTRHYGEHRYLTMQDIENRIITLPVEGQLTNPTVSGVDSNKVDSEYYDGYTYMRVTVDNLSELPSISEYTVTYDGGSETVKYRYLLAGAEDCGNTVTDHSWYTMSEGDNKVIVTPSEMRSFVVLSKTLKNSGFDKNFAGETIYLGADITLDKDTPWNIIGATNLSDEWGKYFAGHFDGNMHTIAGVTVNKDSGRVYGLFGEVKGENAIVENFILSNSSFTIKSSNQTNTYSGCVVGSLNQGTVRNVKCDDTVVLTIGEANDHYNGGLVGRAIEGVIENCWFAGWIKGSGTYQGGILGGLYNSGATCSIEQCLFTGNIVLNPYTGGICGDVQSENKTTVSTLTIRDTLYVGNMSAGDSGYNKGLFIGNVASSAARVDADNLYGHNTTFGSNKKNIGWADGTGANANRTIDAEVTHLARADFNGATGYLNIDLDYYVPEDHEDGTWVIVEGKAPHLKVFGDVAGEQYIDIRTIGGQTDDVRTVWHKPTDEADTFILYSPADLRGFQEVAKTDNFATGGVKDTVKLGADINLSPDWTANKDAPTTGTWTPIGYSEVNTTAQYFAGIFDGDMHSISGVHIDKGVARLGLFGETAAGCEIKNLELTNSYIRSLIGTASICRTGSIVGNLNGSVKNVKCASDVTVVGLGRCAGGIVGTVNSGSIENCWFDGKVQMARTTDVGTRKDMGGIVGGMYSDNGTTNCTITNCLVTGKLDIAQTVGGICGYIHTNSTLNVSDTLFAGSFVEAGAAIVSGRGTVLGDVSRGTATLTNVYVQDGTGLSVKLGSAGSNKDTGVTVLQSSNLTGDACFVNTQLDFYIENQNETGEWVGIKNGLPTLKSFAKSGVLDMTKGIYVDTSWYDTEPYEISTISQLYGLAKLSQTVDFTNKIITLTDSLVLNENEGDAKNWGTNAPKYLWTPIQSFAGTFNGDMNTISGIYVKSDESNLGLFKKVSGKVQNLIFDNSYIENTSTSADTTATGSIVGNLTGTLDTVKSSAHVVLKGSSYAGGLVGDIAGTQQGTMSNCWFAGTVCGTGQHHGTLLGGVHYGSTKGYVEHCLSTGTIDLENNTGGLVGSLWDTAELTISDTLFAGKFDEETAQITENKTYGAVLGNGLNGIINVSNVYVQKGSGIIDSKIIGNVSKVPHNEAQKANVTYVTVNQLALSAARTHTELTICDEADYGNSEVVGVTKFWYISDKYPVLASFAEPVLDYELKVATYNIGYGRKNGLLQEQTVLQGVAAYIQNADLDICLLQEVNDSRTTDVLSSQLTGYNIEYHETDTNDTWGSIGIAIVSKYDIKNTDFVPIPKTDEECEEARGLLKVMIDVNNDNKEDAAVICTHLDPGSEVDSAEGVVLLKTMVNDIHSTMPNIPIIFGGDLNQAYINDAETLHIQDICEFLNSTTSGVGGLETSATPSEVPVWYQLDYIFTNNLVGHGKAEVQKVYMSDGTTELSDHRPLSAILYIKAQ